MKSAYGLLAVGSVAFGFVALSCVSGSTVDGTGGHTGGGQGGGPGSGFGGFITTGQGGTTGGGLGGFIVTGQGGAIVGGQGGAVVGGQGGAVVGGVNGCPRTDVLIDSFDEANRGGPPTGGFFNVNCGVGSWYTYGDNTAGATVTPMLNTAFISAMPGNGGAGYAAHVVGSGFSNYGLGVGVNINSMGTSVKPYNASAYSGITFFAMGTSTATEGANMVRVSVPTVSTSSVSSGGTCVAPAPPAPGYCDGHYGKVIALSATWTKVTILFSELTKDTNALGGATFDPTTIIGVHWQAGGSSTATPAVTAAMNIWIDDLAFVPAD